MIVVYFDVTFGDPEFDEWYLEHSSHNFDSPEFVREHFDAARETLALRPGDPILDAGCGTGSYALEFARRGYRVTGLDVSRTFLREAERRRDAEDLDIEFILGDYNAMDFEQRFSAIVFEGSLFFRTKVDFVDLLRKLQRALLPGGRLKFNRLNPPLMCRWVDKTDWTELEEGVFVLEKTEYVPEDAGTRYHWVRLDLNRGTHYRSAAFIKWLEPDRLVHCLREADFADVRLLKWRELGAFDPETEKRFTVVASKAT